MKVKSVTLFLVTLLMQKFNHTFRKTISVYLGDGTCIVSSQPFLSRSATMTRAPSLAKTWQTALPIPLAPPVTNASLPESIINISMDDKDWNQNTIF